MKYLFYFFIVVVIVLILLGTGFWVFQSGYFIRNTRASQIEISRESSIVFSSPSTLPISAHGKIKVTIFCLDTRGIGIAGLQARLSPQEGIGITDEQPTTDSKGNSIFFVEGYKTGSYDADVYCQGTKIDSKASFSFL